MEHRIIKKRNAMKKIILLLAILAIGAASFGFYYYNKPRTGVSGLQADQVTEAKMLFEEYSLDENAANAKFLGKVVEVSGNVKSTSTDDRGTLNVVIDAGNELGAVNCQFEKQENLPGLDAGSHVTVKGLCSGLLLDVVLVDCEIVTLKK
jgi:hypothetical protein